MFGVDRKRGNGLICDTNVSDDVERKCKIEKTLTNY